MADETPKSEGIENDRLRLRLLAEGTPLTVMPDMTFSWPLLSALVDLGGDLAGTGRHLYLVNKTERPLKVTLSFQPYPCLTLENDAP